MEELLIEIDKLNVLYCKMANQKSLRRTYLDKPVQYIENAYTEAKDLYDAQYEKVKKLLWEKK